MRISISKSSFLTGLQCTKALYLQKHHPDLADDVTLQQQAIFDQGTSVGVLAQQLFPGGVNPSKELPRKWSKSIRDTAELVEAGAPVIYEAGFSVDNVHCFVDILVRTDDGWNAFEVKSSTSVSETNIWDCALQWWVMRKAGLELKEISLVHINNQYTRQEELDLQQLFHIEPVTERATILQPDVERNLAEFFDMLAAGKVPGVDIGPYCNTPYECFFKGHCWQHVPSYPVFDISNLSGDKKWEFYNQGIVKLEDIPPEAPLNEKQWQQVDLELNGGEHIDKEQIREFLSEFEYPLYFLDFESFQPAVPLFDNSRPYQQVVFQYSLHIQKRSAKAQEHRRSEEPHAPDPMPQAAKNFGGAEKQRDGDNKQHDDNRQLITDNIQHKEFLAEAGTDPRLPFIESLIRDVGSEGTIIVFNRTFEVGRLNEIARDFPQYRKEIALLVNRVKDLMVPFQKRWYYKPEMRGSYSIKQVLPALIPEMSYNDMEIADGKSASLAYLNLFTETDLFKIADTRTNLLKYCELDTLAMVKIFENLISISI